MNSKTMLQISRNWFGKEVKLLVSLAVNPATTPCMLSCTSILLATMTRLVIMKMLIESLELVILKPVAEVSSEYFGVKKGNFVLEFTSNFPQNYKTFRHFLFVVKVILFYLYRAVVYSEMFGWLGLAWFKLFQIF